MEDSQTCVGQWKIWRIILVTSGKEWCIDHHCLLSPTLNATCTKSLAKCFTKKLLFASLFHTLTAFLYWQNISGQVSDMEAEQNITKWNEKRSSSFYQRNILLNSFCNLNKFWMSKQQNIFDGGLFCGFLRGGWPLPAALWWKWPKHNSFRDQLKSSYNNKKKQDPFCYTVLVIVIGPPPPFQLRKSEKFPDFCRKNFPDKMHKLRQFSNLRQIRVKSVFAHFKHKHGPNVLPRVKLFALLSANNFS